MIIYITAPVPSELAGEGAPRRACKIQKVFYFGTEVNVRVIFASCLVCRGGFFQRRDNSVEYSMLSILSIEQPGFYLACSKRGRTPFGPFVSCT